MGRSWATVGALVLAAALAGCGNSGGGGSSPLPPGPQGVHLTVATTRCVTASSDQNEFPLPTAAGIAAMKAAGATCVRLPIGDDAVQFADFVNETVAFEAGSRSSASRAIRTFLRLRF